MAIVAALTLLGAFHNPVAVFLACFLAGAGWTTVLASLSVSAQIALPDWVRGRGLAIFLTVVFACIAAGSFVWGFVAAHLGLAPAYYLAAAGAVACVPFTSRWGLQTAEGADLSPSMHWQAPMLAREVQDDSGPVLVTLQYRLAVGDPDVFLDAIEEVGRQRRRDGAYAWGVFADVAERGVYLETFLIGSWLEARYLRERVTNADRALEDEVRKLLTEPPRVTLLIASDSPKTGPAPETNLGLYLTRSETSA
jgi:MFS family permease